MTALSTANHCKCLGTDDNLITPLWCQTSPFHQPLLALAPGKANRPLSGYTKHYNMVCRDILIIGLAIISVPDMLFFTISVIGTAFTESEYKYQL